MDSDQKLADQENLIVTQPAETGVTFKHLRLKVAGILLLLVTTMAGVTLVQKPVITGVFAAGEAVSFSFLATDKVLPPAITTQLMLDAKSNNLGFVKAVVVFDPTKIKLASEVAVGNTFKQNIFVTKMADANASGKLVITAGINPADRDSTHSGVITIGALNWTAATKVTNLNTILTIDTATSQVVNRVPTILPVNVTELALTVNPIIPSLTPTLTPMPSSIPVPPTTTPKPTVTLTPAPTKTPTVTVIPTITAVPVSGKMLTFTALQDATIYSDSPSKNDGNSKILTLDYTKAKNLLIMFPVNGVNGSNVLSVKMRLYANSFAFGGGSFYITTSNWSEANVNWNNAPKAFNFLGSIGSIWPHRWYEVDVTGMVRGDGIYSVRGVLPTRSWSSVQYSSSEGGYPPQLVVKLGE